MIRNKLIIPIYLFKDALAPIFISFLILSSLVFFQQLSRNSEVLFSPLIGWKSAAQILISLLPPIITFTLPVAIAIGETIAIARLAADCEWIALEANSLGRISRFGPFLVIGILGFLLVLTLNWSLAPFSIAKLKDLRTILTSERAISQVKPQAFISEFPNHLIRVKSVNPMTGKWDGVILLRKDETTSEIQLLAAKSGSLTPLDENFESFEVKLSNGVYIKNLLSINDHVTSAFKENTLKVIPAKQRSNAFSLETKDSVQLMDMNTLISKARTTAEAPTKSTEYELELCKRIANAFAAIFAAFCAVLLANHSRPRQTKRITILVACFVLLILFYASLTYGQNLAMKGVILARWAVLASCAVPFLALWLTHTALSKNWFRSLTHAKEKPVAAPSLPKVPLDSTNTPSLSEDENNLPSVNLGHFLVLSEFVQFLLIAIVLLSTTVLLFTMLDIAPSIAKNHIRIDFALGYLVKLAPQIIYYIVPFSVLIAVVAAATALARSGQLTVLVYYAPHPFRLVFPVVFVVLLVCGFVYFLSDAVLPFTNRDQDNRYRQIKNKSLEEVTVAFDRQWVSDMETGTLYGYRLSNSGNQQALNALSIQLSNPNFYLSEITYLEGLNSVESAGTGVSASPSMFRYQIGLDGLAKVEPLSSQEIPKELREPKLIFNETYHEASKMTFKQLKAYIRQVEKTGLPTIGLRMELAQKYTFPIACLTLLFLALPICLIQIRRQHQSRLSAILISTSLALIFWAILSIFEAAGKRGTIPIQLAAWSPHALFLALAATIQLKLHHH